MRRIAIYCPKRLCFFVERIHLKHHRGYTSMLGYGGWMARDGSEHQEETGYVWSFGDSIGSIYSEVSVLLRREGEQAIAYELDGQFFVEDLTKLGESAKLVLEAKNGNVRCSGIHR